MEKLDLTEIREKIDKIDDVLAELFTERMELAYKVAEYKKANNMEILNSKREREIVNRLTGKTKEEYATYLKILYNTIFDLSRSYQAKMIYSGITGTQTEKLIKAVENTEKMLPQSAVVACQGTEGAYSQAACEKLFYNPTIMYFNNFRGVFEAVKSGMCSYGILPLENSVHGSVTEVIDLMGEYDFNIVRSAKIQINHVLLAKSDVKSIADVKEIYSHPQALGQCDKYLSSLKGVKITECENTAMASKLVAETEKCGAAAISSPLCAELYGLKVIEYNVKNNDNNYTRFICISKELEIYPGADKMSFIINISHKPGSLYSLISKFAAVGINLTKIESRPIAGRDFEFRFFFEASVSVYSDELRHLISEFEDAEENFKFLGCYTEN